MRTSAAMTMLLITLALTSIVIAALVLIFYALLAAKARSWFNREERWKAQNRVIAALMVSAGLALALVSK